MKKINVNKETIIGVGLGVLTIAQLVLGNKKDAVAQDKLKAEVVDEVMKKISDQQ